MQSKQLTDKILAEQWIEKWNGVIPTVSCDDGIMIDISKLIGGE